MVLSLENQRKKNLIMAELNKLYNAWDPASLARKLELHNALYALFQLQTGPLPDPTAMKKKWEEADRKRRELWAKWERERKLRRA